MFASMTLRMSDASNPISIGFLWAWDVRGIMTIASTVKKEILFVMRFSSRDPSSTERNGPRLQQQLMLL
jgi:hypothetical protein